KADVRDFDALKSAVDNGVAELGHVDIVSANAGIFAFGKQAQDVPESEWQDVVDINQTGVWHTAKAVIPQMIDQGTGGSIIITSSGAGIKGFPNFVAYVGTKHALVGIMKTLAIELADHNIRVNTRSEEHTSELQSRFDLVCRLLLEKQIDSNGLILSSYKLA